MGNVIPIKRDFAQIQQRAAQFPNGSRILTEWAATQAPSKTKQRTQMHTRKFHAARLDRLTASWLASTLSINQELRGDLDTLRGRARDIAKNNDLGKKFTRLCRTNIVGPNGFKFIGRVMESDMPDKFANDAIESAMLAWAKKGVCDMSGRMSLPDLCASIVGSLPSDGEFIVRKYFGKQARNPFNYALHVIDVDRLDTTFNRSRSNGQNEVIMGIEVDAFRRPLFYHIFTSHQSENTTTRTREAVPADQIIHGYVQETAEQVRGIPWMAAGMLKSHHLGEFDNSALLAARKGADTLGFFVAPEGTLQPDQNGGDTSAEAQISISVPGQYDTLPEGYDFRPYDSRYPDAMYDAFTKSFIRRIANAFGVSYTSLSNDLTEVNFSSIRTGVLEERDVWMEMQNWFINNFLEIVFDDWLKTALLSGAIRLSNGSPLPASKLDKFSAHLWQGRRWTWVDPYKDVQTAEKSIALRIASPQMIAAQNGVDIEDVIHDIAQFDNLCKSYNVLPPNLTGALETPAPTNQTTEGN